MHDSKLTMLTEPEFDRGVSDGEPWDRLRALIEAADSEGLVEALDALPPWEQARAESRLEVAERAALLELLPVERAAELVELVTVPQALDAVEALDPERAAAIVDHLPSDVQADLIAELD